MNLSNSIVNEIEEHVQYAINDGRINLDNKDDWHFHLFNEDYYIIGYYQASEWLKKHDIDSFEAVGICQQYEINTFGESLKVYDNSETTVNMLMYAYGEHWLHSENGIEFIEGNL